MKRKYILLGVAIVLALLVLSCNNSGKTKQNAVKDTTTVAVDLSSKKSFVYTKYELPLSVDVYKFLKSKNVDFNKGYMHSLSKKDKYFTGVSRALVLGIYSSDLAYATIYDKSQESVDYFGVSIDLAHKLDIEQGYDSKVLDRAYDNLNNNDSLSKIAAEAYRKTCNCLEENKTTNILPFIVLGSWLESIHILTQASMGSVPADGLLQELYNQRVHLNGMIKYLSDVIAQSEGAPEIEDMKSLLEKLKLMQSKYELIDGSHAESLNIGQFKDVIFLVTDMRKVITD